MQAVLAALALAALVPEPSGRATIAWDAPAECPDAAYVDALTEGFLLLADADAHAEATIERNAEGRYTLTLRAADGRPLLDREIEAADCHTLAQLVALVVAVDADPLGVLRTRPELVRDETSTNEAGTAVADPVEHPKLRSSDDARPSEPAASNDARPRPKLRPSPWRRSGLVGAQGLVGAAELPGLDAGVAMFAGFGIGRVHLELRGTHLFERTVALPSLLRVEAAMAAWNGSLFACWQRGRSRLRARLCGGPELGAVVARGQGVLVSRRRAVLWAAAVAAPRLEWWIVPWLGLHTELQLVLALRRQSFVVRDDPEASVVVGPGGLRVGVGFTVHFDAR